MDRERMKVVGYRSLTVAVFVVVAAGATWALLNPLTRIPERIAVEAVPTLTWQVTAQPDAAPRGPAARIPLVRDVLAPARGEWVWHVGGTPEVVGPAVVAWLLQRPPPQPVGVDSPTVEVPPIGGLEGRVWDGRVVSDGTSTLRGEAASALRSVTVTVMVQPMTLVDDVTQVTVRVE